MEVEKLHKEDFVTENILRGTPSIRFAKSGFIILSRSAVVHLKLISNKSFYCISICRDRKDAGEFSIMRDIDGWQLRLADHGCVCFNNACLAHHVIDKTWEKVCHNPTTELKPDSYTFLIALKPLDDDKNKNVFALLRKKP